ncbi:hypothetical protein CANARDRAFT_228646 [[Candida] arabinofermentans NRRL YB-2248]|uniref:Rab-GAP TBC domain-containing protein n=1 Tax=[Candida] arabinofermentans NRRL YB-2248 TaxID=983967 RepID=A0A1E4T8J1_9ASCO|nr:hypothetical protein CANARDRAFT_228646 [[Candida] arabinofermentans NRRL YB-2248]
MASFTASSLSTSTSVMTTCDSKPEITPQKLMNSSILVQPEWIEMEICDVGNSIFNELPLSKENLNLKVKSLNTALVFKDLKLLKLLASTRNGLLNKGLRSTIWPELFIENHAINDTPTDWHDLPKHKDEDQVLKDVERSFVSFPKGITPEELKDLRTRLNNLIVRVIRTTPALNYYQGYHDVATIVVLVFDDDDLAFKFLHKLTLSYLRDHMLPHIESTVKQLNLISELLEKIDYKFFKAIGSIPPLYALSSVISVFSHDLSKFDDLCLVWDFIFVHDDPALIIYIYASILIYYKDDILNDLDELSGKSFSSDDTLIDESSTSIHEDEFYNRDFIHVILNNLIDNNLNSTNSIDSNLEIYNILQLSLKYINKYPPSSLKLMSEISDYSVLKAKRSELELLKSSSSFNNEPKRPSSSLPKKKGRLSSIILRNKSLSLILKLSLGIGLLSIIINYTVSNHPNVLSHSFIKFRSREFGVLNSFSVNAIFKDVENTALFFYSSAGKVVESIRGNGNR